MAVPNILIDTTFSGKDITTAISVYEYTVTATGSLRIQVRLAAVAGGGDYVAYLTLNDGDAQTDDPVLPKTTLTAAAGETAFWFSSITVDAIAGDVINIFVKGLAGDTSEAGSIRIFSDAALQPSTAGRTLTIESDGMAHADLKEWLGVAPAALTASGYLQAIVQRWLTDNAAGTPSALVSNRVDASVGAMAADVITAAAHDESTAFPLKAADTGATQVARVGADGDTLETLSDQVDLQALEATLTAIKGAGWSAETLKAIYDVIAALNDLDAAGIRTAVGLASANLDTQLAALPTDADVLSQAEAALVSTDAAIALVKVDTAAILLDTGTDGVVVASHTTAAKAELQTEANDALVAQDLDHLIQVTAGSEEPTDGSYLDQVMHKSASQTFDASTDSLEAIRDTLSAAEITVVSAVDGGTVTVVPYTTWEFTIDGLADLSDALVNGVLFTVKEKETDADSVSILQVQEGVGLKYINGAAGTASKATLVVAAGENAVTVHVNASVTGIAGVRELVWDIKKVVTSAEDADQVATGTFVIAAQAVTKVLVTS